jgi:murein DD-endopeptidase MepM/ murein hydrolase activator NlpD
MINGIEDGGFYSNNVTCKIIGQDNYKIDLLNIYIDSKPLIESSKVKSAKLEETFILSTNNLEDGKHRLKIEIESGSFNRLKSIKEIEFIVDNKPLKAAFVKNYSNIKIYQGKTLHIQFQTNKPIKDAKLLAFGKEFNCFPEEELSTKNNNIIYEGFLPIDCEQNPNEYIFTIDINDNVGNNIKLDSKFDVIQFNFKKQYIKFNSEKIKIENESGLSEKVFEQEIENITKKSPCKKLWKGIFYSPTDIKDKKQITTEFGTIRTTQERGLRQHKALDIVNTPKSVIIAPQDGIIVIKNRYAHSGNTIVIDHGYGLLTMLFHLDTFANIELFEHIKKGHPVGTLGKTGYATGYHLHWEMRLNNIAIDPLEWTKVDF